ncbi:MAG: hypothetical protein QXQ57_06790 [Sulfolobales archaeon]
MKDKVKTSIVVDRDLWERFKSRVAVERGLRTLSRAVEEAIEEELYEQTVIRALEELLQEEMKAYKSIQVTPVKPRVTTDAGYVVRELRDSRG